MIKIPTYLDNINDWRDTVKGKSIILDSDTIIALLKFGAQEIFKNLKCDL